MKTLPLLSTLKKYVPTKVFTTSHHFYPQSYPQVGKKIWGRKQPVSRVLFIGSHLSGERIAPFLKRPTRGRGEQPLIPPIWSCSGWGLPSLSGRPDSWWALTPPFHPYPALSPRARRSVFCGTFLGVTPTGCYPASCSVELGLSSGERELPRGYPVTSAPIFSMCPIKLYISSGPACKGHLSPSPSQPPIFLDRLPKTLL